MAIDVDKVIAWETGQLDDKQTVGFFADLIKSGDCWRLQGCYGRFAHGLIENGVVSREGEILMDEFKP